MDNSLYLNGSKCVDPTAGVVLNKLMREERNRQAWLQIARKMQIPVQNTGLTSILLRPAR